MPKKDPNPKYNYKELYPNTYKLAEGLTTYVPGYKKYTPENFIDMLQLISNAETGNKNIAQMGGGPGRGFYQMEKRSSKVAKNRAVNINNDLINLGYKQGITIPQFNEDFTKLSKDDQAVYVLSNMVKAASSKRATNPNAYVNPLDPKGSWADYHWAGKAEDRPAREKHWDEVNSNFNDILNNIYNQEYSIYSKEHGLKTNTQPDTPRIMDAPEFIKGAWDNTQGGWLDKFADGGVVPSVPIVEDAGEMSQDNVWVPNWKVIAEQAKKLNAKTVKTKSGVTINFDFNWNVKSVNEAPMFKDGGETPLTDPKNKPTVYRSSGRSNYDPLSNNIYFNPNNNPWNPYDILKHEGYHWAQNMYGDLQAPELYPGPLRRPQTPTNPNTSLISDYYNRAAIENDVSLNYMKQGRNAYVDEKGKSLMPDNVVVPSSPSLQFIPDDIIWKGVRTTNRPYNEYTIIPGADALRYSTPDTIEGDAMHYENNAPMNDKPIMGIYDLQDTMQHKHGGLIKRADGSYSRRGLWDNIRANRGSGRKPTAEMLRQERKIKKHADGSWVTDSSLPTPTTPSFYDAYPDRTLTNYQMGTDKAPMYGGGGGINPIYVTNPNDPRLRAYNDSLSLYNNYMNLKNTIVKGGKYYPDFESSKPLYKTKTYKFTIPNPNNPIIYKQVDPTFGYNKIGDKGLPDITIIQKKNIQPISTQTFTRKESKYKSEAEYDKAAKQIKDFNEKAGQANWIGYEIQEYKKPIQPVNLKKEEELKREEIEPVTRKFDFSVNEDIQPIAPTPYVPNPVRRVMNPNFQESDYTVKHNSIVDPLGNPKYKYYNQDKVITQQEYDDLMQKKANGGPVMYNAGSTVWTKQDTPLWAAGTPTPTATQNFRNDRSLNTDLYRIGDVIPTGMDYKTPAAGTYDYSKDIQPYHTMRLHAPDTTRMGDGGPTTPIGGLWDTDRKAFVDSTLQANMDKEWVRRLYNNNAGSIQIPGEKYRSTHLMSNDNTRVYPSIQNINGKLTYLPGDQGYDYADETKSYINFNYPQQADWFAANGYKIGTNVLNSINTKGTPVNNPNYVLPKHKHGSYVKKHINSPRVYGSPVNPDGMSEGPTMQRGTMMFGNGSTVGGEEPQGYIRNKRGYYSPIEGATTQFEGAKDYYKGWFNSPIYKQIIQKQADILYGDDEKKKTKFIDRTINSNINNWKDFTENPYLKENLRDTGIFGESGASTLHNSSSTLDLDFVKNNPILANSLYAHELAHRQGMEPFATPYDYSHVKELTPAFNPAVHKPGGRFDENGVWHDVVPAEDLHFMHTEPDEVRTEIHAVRQLAKQAGVYDPYTEPFTKEHLDKIEKLFNEGGPDGKNFNQLGRLRKHFSDESVIDMMNTISQNNNQPTTNTQMAKRGGYVKNNNSNTWLDQYN